MTRTELRGPWHDWPLRPLEILAALERQGLRYVVIGGFAAVVHGSPLPTYDLDVAPADDAGNRTRLRRALRELRGKLLADTSVVSAGSEDALQFIDEAQTLEVKTPLGFLDVHFQPAGTRGYVDLRRGAGDQQVSEDLRVSIASLADIVRSKEAAGREQDLAALPALRATLELELELEAGRRSALAPVPS